MFENVKQEIDDKIKTNGNNEITATRLNGVLQDMMDASAEVIEEVQRSIGDQVEANPTEAATDSLEKIKIGEKVYNIPDPDTSNFVTNQELQQELSDYVQKTDPPSPAADDLVAFDQYGGFGSSGKKVTDFATAEQGAKADTAVQPSALNNYVQKSQTTGLLKNDGTVDTQTVGKAASALQPISGATENNFAAFDANGGIKDSGNKSADFATAAQGAKADTAVQQVTVGTTTTGAAGSNASVTNSGTSTAPVLDFTIPRGADAVNPFKGWFDANITGEAGSKVVDDTANLPESPTVGDYAYVKTLDITGVAPTQTETPVVKIYECTNAGSWSDSGRTADTSNVQTFASGEEVNGVHIVNDLNTGGATDLLSAEQGLQLNNKILKNNYEYNNVVEGTNVTIPEFLGIVFPAGTKFYVYPDTERTIRFYEGSNYTNVVPGNSFTCTNNVTNIQKRLGDGRVHILINQTTPNFNESELLYDKISIKNLISKNVVVNVVNFEITSTSTTTNIFSSSVPLIPANSVIHIETSDFSSFAKRIRYYFNDAAVSTNLTTNKLITQRNYDITNIRFAISTTDFVEGATGGTISVKLWWEDVKYQIDDLIGKVRDLDDGLKQLTKQRIIDAAGALYDSTNDKFLPGTIECVIGTDLTNDLLCNYVAKYTSSNDNYPYITAFYLSTPFNSPRNRFKYELGGNGYYKYGECRCICPIKPPLNQSVYKDYYMVEIVVPEGCELFIQSISSDTINRSTNINSFRTFNHGASWGSGFNSRTNWDSWSHIGNYGAVVVPKRTTDGRWVCYHNDSFESNPDVQVIGNPSAPLPASSMQECTFAETQTLEYKNTNYFGEHDTIPTLDEFFAKCSQMGIHPMLSVHPNWTESQWQEIKELARRYDVLDKLNIKGTYSISAATIIHNVFGNDIESYIPDNTSATLADVESLAAIGFDTSKIKIGFEYIANTESLSFFSDEIINALRQNGMVSGIYLTDSGDGHFIKNLIENKLLWEYTSNLFYSNGLNWY